MIIKEEFIKIKEMVRSLINSNREKELTVDTDNTSSGVYMLYVDSFEDERILPIYIGQAVNMQRRYSEHVQDILSINRMDSKEYHNHFM